MYKEDQGAPAVQDAGKGDSAEGTAQLPGSQVYVHALSDLERCHTCHQPHFSEERALIVEPIQRLCGKCHDYKEASFAEAHIDISAAVMDCRNCHAPHTSSDPMFFKDELHKPFAARTCKDCHIVEKP
jgi:predicted CXXCH cytochrome family protein